MANAPATDLAQHLQRIEVDGFTILPKVIDAELITAIKQELSPYLQGQHPGRNDFEGLFSERVYALLSKAPSIAKIIEHPALLPILDALLPPGFLLSAALAIDVHPGETPQPMHIDDNAGNLPFPRPRAHFRREHNLGLGRFHYRQRRHGDCCRQSSLARRAASQRRRDYPSGNASGFCHRISRHAIAPAVALIAAPATAWRLHRNTVCLACARSRTWL